MAQGIKLERKTTSLSTKFITELMDYSEFGGIMHAFVLEGLRLYANKIIARQEEIPDNGLLSRELLVSCAKEYLTKLEARKNG